MMRDVDFAALIKALRTACGLTQEDFARKLDVTVGTMNGWENGKHLPLKAQRRRLLRLAKGTRIAIRMKPGSPRKRASRK